MAYVYSHTRLDKDEIFYIGIGSDKDYKRAYSIKGRNSYWYRLIRKVDYRVDILINNITWEEACKEEVRLIKQYGRKKYGGTLVNVTEGGEGFKSNHSQKTKDQIRDFYKGKSYEQIYGEERAAEQRENRRKGVACVWQRRTEEQKKEIFKKISEKTTGRKLSQEAINNLVEGRRKYRNIKCYTLDNVYVKTYKVLEDVAADGFTRQGVRFCLVGQNASHKKHLWKID
jgi:hypothetical protein